MLIFKAFLVSNKLKKMDNFSNPDIDWLIDIYIDSLNTHY